MDENDFTVSGYSGVYDGESHGIGRFIWGSTNYEITFKDKDGNYTLTSSEWPEYTNVGDYLVEYRLTNENYEPYYGSEQIHISPAPLTVTAEDKTVTYKEEAPVYSYVATGFVHGEDESYWRKSPIMIVLTQREAMWESMRSCHMALLLRTATTTFPINQVN
ncbi:MAG: MBG domain-containing protein [Lachnospiraceae bacterium]